MEDKQYTLLEKLCNSFGPSGFEQEPIRIIREYISPYCDKVYVDNLGSFMFEKNGTAREPRILLPGHVDEVGFVISGISDKGFCKFNPVGGWFDQVLLGQRVIIRTHKGEVEGIIAAKPPHLLPPEDREKVVKKRDMYVDLGCSNKREAEEMGVRIGDPVMPNSHFSITEKRVFEKKGDQEIDKGVMKLALGKAFDDRIGAFIATEVVRRLQEENISHPNTVIGAATTQEEVGARGARTAAWLADPDVCITLEVDIAGDVQGIEQIDAPACLGKGPTILAYDASLIPNQGLKEFVIEIAERHTIPYQLTAMPLGGTDAGIIHMIRAGCPSLVLGIPTRHIHSHVGFLSLTDVEFCINLVIEVLKNLDIKISQSFVRA